MRLFNRDGSEERCAATAPGALQDMHFLRGSQNDPAMVFETLGRQCGSSRKGIKGSARLRRSMSPVFS